MYELHDSLDEVDGDDSVDDGVVGVKCPSASSLIVVSALRDDSSMDDKSRLALLLSASSAGDCIKSFSRRFRVRITSRLIDTGLYERGEHRPGIRYHILSPYMD